MIVTAQKISEMTPKMLSCDTLTGCGSLGLKSVCTVYSGLVPMSPKTTPRAPSVRAPCAATRRLTPKVSAPCRRLPRATLTNHPLGAKAGEHAVQYDAELGPGLGRSR